MTPPTPEELLRLARKAFPLRPEMGEDERDVPGSIEPVGHRLELCSAAGAQIIALPGDHPRRIEGLHALLLVLAGELDVAELLAERDRLRDGLKAIEELVLDYTRAIGQIPAGGPILAIAEAALKEDP